MNTLWKRATETIKEYCNPFWLPVTILFLVIPNIVYYKVYKSRLADYAWTPQDDELSVDFYLYYKQFYFVLLAGSILIFSIILLTKNRKQFFHKKTLFLPWIPLGIYLILSLLSALFSPYRKIAFTGSDQQFESILALCGYGIACFYMTVLLKKKQDFKYIAALIYAAIIFWTILGLLQSFGQNPFRMEWFQRLITPKGYLEAMGPIKGVFEEGYISLFSYNPNYAGVLLCVCSVFCLVQLVKEKRIRHFLWKFIIFIAVWIALYHTRSDAGILVSLAVSAIFLICFTKPMKKIRYIIVGIASALTAITLLLCVIGNNPVHDKLTALLKNKQNPLTEMITDSDGVHITYRNLSFILTADYILAETPEYSEYKIMAETEDGTELPVIQTEDGSYYLGMEGFHDVTMLPAVLGEDIPVVILQLGDYNWYFLKYGGEYYLLNEYNNIEKLEHIERISFEGYELLATHRGMIWSYTLPLLKKTFLLGSGASTFAHMFPQNNYYDQIYYEGGISVATRPHSYYLQVAVESGVLALIALLVFFGWYLISSLKCYWNAEYTDKTSQIGLGCFLMVLAYLVCMLTNDSMIVTAPVFWGILGIGIAANRIINQE